MDLPYCQVGPDLELDTNLRQYDGAGLISYRSRRMADVSQSRSAACLLLAGPLLLEKIPIYWILGSRALTPASAQKTDTQPTMLYQVDQNKLKTLKVENYAENSNEFDLDPEI